MSTKFFSSVWAPANGCDTGRFELLWLLLLAMGVLSAYALNATLIFDDLWILSNFSGFDGWNLSPKILLNMFSSVELGGEYRLYGLSKLLHLGLFFILGIRAWAWAMVMGISQIATGWMVWRLFRGFGVEKVQAAAPATVYVFSPFVFTSCFHHL